MLQVKWDSACQEEEEGKEEEEEEDEKPDQENKIVFAAT